MEVTRTFQLFFPRKGNFHNNTVKNIKSWLYVKHTTYYSRWGMNFSDAVDPIAFVADMVTVVENVLKIICVIKPTTTILLVVVIDDMFTYY